MFAAFSGTLQYQALRCAVSSFDGFCWKLAVDGANGPVLAGVQWYVPLAKDFAVWRAQQTPASLEMVVAKGVALRATSLESGSRLSFVEERAVVGSFLGNPALIVRLPDLPEPDFLPVVQAAKRRGLDCEAVVTPTQLWASCIYGPYTHVYLKSPLPYLPPRTDLDLYI